MPSCRRHAAPPPVTFLQEGGKGGHPRTLPSFRCHPGAPFCVITARASASTILYFYSYPEKKIRKKAVEKMTNNAALRRDYRHQKMNALLGPTECFSCYIRLVIFIQRLPGQLQELLMSVRFNLQSTSWDGGTCNEQCSDTFRNSNNNVAKNHFVNFEINNVRPTFVGLSL